MYCENNTKFTIKTSHGKNSFGIRVIYIDSNTTKQTHYNTFVDSIQTNCNKEA